ncbi:transglycosylase domain-containing protein [Flaviflexus equikiangi]|uniref:Penicillin-binding protein n=1 Tax=Flaviflexus equikiangi TaxID=2758573 RepID=A0ABS2TFK7_9ACTO|nr:transglycosylase domain-containing protein [Flaviflexus equikiangi]MBM9432296.1 penicillin-binding protein [Flaviflexus equikiangi]
MSSSPQTTPARMVSALLAFLLACTAGGFVLAGLAMPLVAATGTVSNATTSLFDDLPTELTFTEPSEQSVILAADGTELARFYAENRVLVASEDISQHLKNAVVAIEDERFFEHNGIDPQGLIGAAFNNFTGGQLAGGSTITQQYVKNLLIEEGRNSNDPDLIAQATERSLARKLSEARTAMAIEKQMEKDEILTGYINIAMFGPSQYGAEAASQYFFSVPASELSIPQAAMLAGITQSPARWNPISNPDEAKNRRDTVLAKMYELGYITEDEFRESVNLPIADMLNVSAPVNGCESAGISVYFCEYVVKDLLASESWGDSQEDRLNQLYRGGLVIHTTLDTSKQQAAFDAVTTYVPVNDPSSVEMAMSSVEPGTGKIVSMVQNTNYGSATPEDPNATTVNLNVGMDRGGGYGFQSGSTFKVYTLIEWIRAGRGLDELVDASRDTYTRDDWTISCAPEYADAYNPSNIEGIGSGMMTVLESTKRSVNLSFIDMASQLDLCNIVGVAEQMGVRSGNGAALTPNPSSVLGSNNVTPLSTANSMATLASGGIMCEPLSFTKIENQDGDVIADISPSCVRVLDEDVADTTTSALQTVVSPGGTGFRAEIPGHDAAGKTGTANMDYHAWFMGYTSHEASAIWLGHMEGNISMFYTTINGQYNIEVYGGLYPAQVFSAYHTRILEGVAPVPFSLQTVAANENGATVLPQGRDNPAIRPVPVPEPEPQPEPEPAPSEESDPAPPVEEDTQPDQNPGEGDVDEGDGE